MTSLWTKVFRSIGPKRVRPIGYDLQGNKYFELPDPNGGRDRRTVEYAKVTKTPSLTTPNATRTLDYRQGTAQLPVQWSAWMSYTRDTPPTMAELQKDAARQAGLHPLIAQIEARERAERIQQGFLLPDGSEVPRPEVDERIPEMLTREQMGLGAPRAPVQVEAPAAAAAAVGQEAFLAPPRETVDPASADDAVALRKLAEEDTRRRLRESGVAEESGPVEGVEGVGRSFKPARRRGGAAA